MSEPRNRVVQVKRFGGPEELEVVDAPLPKVGTHCISASSVYFDDVEVPEDRLIGECGMGWRHLVDTLNTERLVTAAGRHS